MLLWKGRISRLWESTGVHNNYPPHLPTPDATAEVSGSAVSSKRGVRRGKKCSSRAYKNTSRA